MRHGWDDELFAIRWINLSAIKSPKMSDSENTANVAAKVVYELVKVLSQFSSALIEPGRIRRVAAANAEATKVLADAEIDRERRLSDARYRLEAVELQRQKNLEDIALFYAQNKGPRLANDDRDWVVGFVEACKDTSDPTLQDIWAKLLAGEMEAVGSCSKRTLQMVKSLSRGEAILIKEVCRRVCVVEESDGRKIAFVNVFVNRLEQDVGEDEPNSLTLYLDDTIGRQDRNDRLMSCGFLSYNDFKFYFNGEGRLDPAHFQLSSVSPKRISLGARALVADAHQPGLLFQSRKVQGPTPQIRTPAASIEFDAWRLSAEGEELFRALHEKPDFELLKALEDALSEGGLSVTVIEC